MVDNNYVGGGINSYIKDLDKHFEKGDIIKIEGNKKIYIIKYNQDNLLKYCPDFFMKRGKKANVSLLIKKGKNGKKMGGAFLENIFNKREDENTRITIPYKHFYDAMNYLFKRRKPEEKGDFFNKTMETATVTIQKDDIEETKILNQEEKKCIFKENEETKKEGETQEEDEIDEKKIKVVIEGEFLEFTREYYEDKRRERKE